MKTALAGADIVLSDRVLAGATLIIEHGEIQDVVPRGAPLAPAPAIDFTGHLILPGFVDVHVHGIEGVDCLQGPDAVARIAAMLPKYGVTAFCPTSVACAPDRLATFLASVRETRAAAPPRSARVLPAHLESNFVNEQWNGAQPVQCLRAPAGSTGSRGSTSSNGEFEAADILRVIAAHRDSVGIVTLAPELPGGIDLVRDLVAHGHRVSIGHSGATYEEAKAAIDAGARHATHLFNRMSPIAPRAPGVVGAVLESNAVTAEIICDGHHVHPALVRLAIHAKSISRTIAITDGTAASGLARGSRARLGDQAIVAGERTAVLDDGTMAGSLLTMDGALRMLTGIGVPLFEAARMCASTPAEALGLADTGAIAAGQRADLVVLDRDLRVRQTYVGGVPALEH